MILSIAKEKNPYTAFDEIGLGTAMQHGGSVLIKINLSQPPQPLHPRTDPALLASVIQYAARNNAGCAIAEGANGFLTQNLESIGLGVMLKEHQVRIIDLDLEEADCVRVDDEKHYLPRCLRNYAVRLGLPATSKRPGMVFSNNIKLFVGAVPRRMYQNGEGGFPRPRVHVDLHKSIVNIYRAVMDFSPFDFFINGGRAMFEDRNEIDLPETFIGNDALELDRFMLDKFSLEPPDYIHMLAAVPGMA